MTLWRRRGLAATLCREWATSSKFRAGPEILGLGRPSSDPQSQHVWHYVRVLQFNRAVRIVTLSQISGVQSEQQPDWQITMAFYDEGVFTPNFS